MNKNGLRTRGDGLGRTLSLIGSLFFAFLSSAQAAVEVSGSIAANTTWTTAQGPYTVTGDVIVDDGATLTIEPGVTVYMNPATHLTVNAGSLVARGTAVAPIVITSANDTATGTPAVGDWGQVRVLDGASDAGTVLEYVDIRYGQGVVIQAASPTLNYLNIKNSAGPAISQDLQSSPLGIGNQATGNTINGVVVPAGDILGSVTWGIQGIPYVVAQGIVSVGQTPSISSISPNVIQQGETLTATIAGNRLGGAERIIFDDPNLSGTIAAGGTASSVPVQITAAATASLGPAGLALQVAAGQPRLAAGLTVVQTQAKLTALTPNTLYTTQPGLTLTATGENFVAESTVMLDNAALVTSYVSQTSLTAQVPAQTVGTRNIAVRSPDPRNSGSFLVSNPLPLYVVVPNLSMAPASLSVVRGTSDVLTLNIPYAAPVGGVTIALSSDAGVATVPASVTIAEGTTSIDVSVTGVGAGSTNIFASLAGFNGAQAAVTVTLPPTVILPSTSLVSPGQSGALALTLNVPAPAGGLLVTLLSSDPTVASVPATFLIPQGQSSAVIPVSGVGVGTATITASAAGYDLGTTTISVENVDFTVALQGSGNYANSLAVPEGATALFEARLSRPAPAGGLSFTLATGDSAFATVSPTTVTIPAGSTAATQTLTVTGVARGATTLVVSAPGLNTSTLVLTVTDRLQLQFNVASVTVGAGLRAHPSESFVCRTQNNAYYYAGTALAVSLASSDAAYASVPASVTIPSGSACTSFQVTGVTVTGATVVNVDATAAGYLAPIAKLAVNVIAPTVVINYLNGARNTLSRLDDMQVQLVVPGAMYSYSQTPAAPLTVNVAVTDATPAGIVDIYSQTTGAVVSQGTIGINQSSVWFNVGKPAAPGSYTISASAPGFVPYTSPVQSVADGANARLQFSVPTVVVGKQLFDGVTLYRTLADGSPLYDAEAVTVTLASSDPTRVTVPTSVTIPAGSNSASVWVTGVELTVPLEPPSIEATAAGYVSPVPGLFVTVVTPELRFTGLDGTRSTLSTARDQVCVGIHVPGAASPDSQWPVTALTVDWSVTDANPAGIVAALYNDSGVAVTQTTYHGPYPNPPSCLNVGQPTAIGSYTLTAAIAGLAAATSPVQTVTGNAARLAFSRPTMTIGLGLDAHQFGVYVARAVYAGAVYDLTQPLTVTLTSSDPARATVPDTVVIPANSTFGYFTVAGVGLTNGTPVMISATATGVDTPITNLAVNVVTPDLRIDSLSGVRTPLSDRNSMWVGFSVPGVDGVSGNALNPVTIDLAALDLGTNLARTATITASSRDVAWSCGECGYDFFDNPESAVDGMRDSVFVTQYENRAWWQADLGSNRTIDRLYVHLTTGSQIAILVASLPFVDSDFGGATLPATYTNGATVIYQTASGTFDALVALNGPITGRYVRVVALEDAANHLELREVELFQGGGGASGIVSFYDDFAAGNQITQVTIPAGQSSVFAYIGQPTATGNYLVSASAAGMNTAISDPQVVNPPRLWFQWLPALVAPGSITTFWVDAIESIYSPLYVSADTVLTLTSSNAAAATVTSSATIPAGNSGSSDITLNALSDGASTITATTPGFDPATQTITVGPLPQ